MASAPALDLTISLRGDCAFLTGKFPPPELPCPTVHRHAAHLQLHVQSLALRLHALGLLGDVVPQPLDHRQRRVRGLLRGPSAQSGAVPAVQCATWAGCSAGPDLSAPCATCSIPWALGWGVSVRCAALHPPPAVWRGSGGRLTTSVCHLRHDQMEQGLPRPHAGRSRFLLSAGGAEGGYY